MNTVELKYPIDVSTSNGVTQQITKITIGRMKTKHLKLMPKGLTAENASSIDPAGMIPLIAGLAGITEEEAGEIDIEDLPVVAEAVTSAMGEQGPQKTIES